MRLLLLVCTGLDDLSLIFSAIDLPFVRLVLRVTLVTVFFFFGPGAGADTLGVLRFGADLGFAILVFFAGVFMPDATGLRLAVVFLTTAVRVAGIVLFFVTFLPLAGLRVAVRRAVVLAAAIARRAVLILRGIFSFLASREGGCGRGVFLQATQPECKPSGTGEGALVTFCGPQGLKNANSKAP